jgi:hypothetical protein
MSVTEWYIIWCDTSLVARGQYYDHSEFAQKWCNHCPEFMLAIFAIYGNDFGFIVDIIPMCKYLNNS